MTANYTGASSLSSAAKDVFRAGTLVIYSFLNFYSIFDHNYDMTLSTLQSVQPVATKNYWH